MEADARLKLIGVVEDTDGENGKIRVFSEFCAGLKRIESFSHIIIVYWAHQRDNPEERKVLLVYPRRHAEHVQTGVFACRSPSRPNPIGLCVVELLKVEGCNLTVKGLDAFEKTPIIDIKPYLPRADSIPSARVPDWTSRGPPT